MDGWMWMWRGKKGGSEALGRATQSRLQMCRQQQCGCFGPHQAALGVSPAHVPTLPVNQPSQASGSTAATKPLRPDPQNRPASDRRTPTSPLCRVKPPAAMWNSRGLPSPAVAQEVEDVWRGRRVLLSLSAIGLVLLPAALSPPGLTLDLPPCCHQWPRWPDEHTERKQHKACACSPTEASSSWAVYALSCLNYHLSLFSGLAYHLEPVSARYYGPTHPHPLHSSIRSQKGGRGSG
ncbi:hypothetical protein D5F01_LYC02519 [Larimichthys crocea]|uniref:Uncharacterized protein n=1 Tax=Larimichthys crocea TaxID=215358 RepID=A0A6G0J3I9_LARCR|nr:hypothetical protein D5F01_LYC02519 [Larimichthys crocea]